MIRLVFWFIAMTMLLEPVAFAQAQWDRVATALGKSGAEMPGQVYRVALPRTDLKVSVDGVDIKPGFALGGWVAFKSMGSSSMVMGDLVLTETEINPVMSKLFENGLTVTAVHNHLLRAQPATFYMHIAGKGDPEKLASALRVALAESKTPLTAASAAAQPAVDLDVAKLNDILGARGNPNGGVVGYGIPRTDPVTDEGMVVPPAMGTAIAINFQPAGDGRAAITGDFVLLADEVNPVLVALRQHGIEVTAVHSHMLDDQPRTFFVHFWAVDDAVKLAGGLRAALDKVKRAKS
jgi:Domain of Unknown Function (DUF1259)